MATEVYTTEIIRLLDETEVELRPLPIAKLRKFMRMWSEHIGVITKKIGENTDKEMDERDFTEADLTDAQFDVFIKMCALALESQLKKDDETASKFEGRLEDVLDEKTIYRILDVTGGLKLGDQAPNLQTPTSLAAGAGTN
jgi:hypothetical protein